MRCKAIEKKYDYDIQQTDNNKAVHIKRRVAYAGHIEDGYKNLNKDHASEKDPAELKFLIIFHILNKNGSELLLSIKRNKLSHQRIHVSKFEILWANSANVGKSPVTK